MHKGVKKSFSGLIYFFPNVHLRFVILEKVQVTLLLPRLQTALLFFKISDYSSISKLLFQLPQYE